MSKNPVASLLGRVKAGLATKNSDHNASANTRDTPHENDGNITSSANTDPQSAQPVTTAPNDTPTDPLANAIADISAHFGKPLDAHSLTAGLPLVNEMLPLDHAELAATRANLRCEFEHQDPQKLETHDLPVIIVMADNTLKILWRLEHDTHGKPTHALLSDPGNPRERASIQIETLTTSTSKTILRLRPSDSYDQRARTSLKTKKNNWFISAFRDSRKIYAEAIAATVAINFLGLAMPLFSMNVYDRVLPNAAEATLWALALGVFIAIVFDFSIRTLRSVFVDAAGRRADVQLANLIYGRLMGARISTSPTSIGVRANTMREYETLREFFNSATLTAFGDLPFLALFLLVMWLVAGPLVFIVIAAIPVILGIGWLTQRVLGRLVMESFREAAQKNAVVVETLTGLETIKANGAESWAASKWERSVAEHVRTGLSIRHATNLGQHAVHATQTIVQVSVVILGFYLVAAGQLTMGALIAATILSGRALQPLAQTAQLLARANQTRIAYQTLSEIVNAPQERPPGETFLAKTEFNGEIEFDNVSFSYSQDAQPALRELQLRIKPGEHVAIIGGIGSGKSTALKLLHALITPTHGRVLIDGVSASQVEPTHLRANVGLLLQDADLFHGSLRENITISNPQASEKAILWAAKMGGALEWIAGLPQGFDTPIRERGAGLSGGQHQSLALARALLRQPKIIALDEPTSDMDGRTEHIIITQLKSWARGRTMIIVTHRPALLELVDRIIVLEGGQKLHDGPKAQVLASLQAQTTKRSAGVTHARTKTSSTSGQTTADACLPKSKTGEVG